MAIKSRTTLVSDSDATFLDNTSGQIIPANHRTFNDDVIESVANLTDDNTFDGVNTFDNLVINKQRNTYINAASSVDLSSIDGNIVYINGSTTISQFIGNVGQIMYVTIVDGVLFDAQGGVSMRPPHNINLNAGDTIIFHFTETDVIRILGHWRQNGQQWFELTDVAAYTTLVSNNALQIGSLYYIPDGYEYPTDVFWSILIRAINTSEIDSGAYIRRNGAWIPVLNADSSLGIGTLQISCQTDVQDILEWAIISNNPTSQQWMYGSSAFTYLDGDNNVSGAFYGRVFFDSYNAPIYRNMLSMQDSNRAFFGRIDLSPTSGNNRFYTHHGKSVNQWGNNPDYEFGFNDTQLNYLNNSIYGNQISNGIIQSANYSVVNDLVTINASVYFETKFNQGVAGHECLLYFPLPFINNEIGCGHGSLRFESINNHQNIGAIVTQQDSYVCMVSAKWDSSISSATDVTLAFSFSYITDPTA